MAGSREVKLKVLGDASSALSALSSVEKAAIGLRKGMAVVGAAVAGASAALAAFGYKAIQQASDLEETQSKVRVIFGDSSEAVFDFAKTAASALGQTKQEALDAVSTFAMFGQAAGLAGQDLVNFSTDFTKLATDLASFNNTSPQDAIQAIGAALRGESEPLRRYNVLLSDQVLREKARELGIYSGSKALTAQQKVLAAQAAIYEQTSLAQGDFERTSEGLANQQRILKASLENLVTSIGQALLPHFQRLVKALNDRLVPAVEAFSDALGEKGIGEAVLYGIAATGDFGIKMIDTLEMMSVAVLTFLRDFASMGEKIGMVGTLVGALSGDLRLSAMSATAGIALGQLETTIDKKLANMGDDFDALRGKVRAASNEIGRMSAAQKAQGWFDYRKEENGVKKLKTSFDDLFGSVDTGGKTTKSASDKLKEFTTALKNKTSAAKQAKEATDSLTKANDDLKKATQDVADAQAFFDQITRGYGAGSKQAKDKDRQRSAAQRDLERAGYGVEEAIFAVTEAEQRLTELRADPETNATAIRQAEIALAEAKLRVADANDQQYNATISLEQANQDYEETLNGAKEGSDAFTDALKALQRAKDEQAAASDRVRQAQEKEIASTWDLWDATKALQELIAQTPKSIQATAYADEEARKTMPKEPAKTGAAYPNFMSAVRALHPNAKSLDSATPVAASRAQFPKLYQEYKQAGLALADGGVVRRPTTALIGEAGPEAVIPLANLSNLGTTNVHVTINAGMGTDASVVADEIVNVLQRYNRRNGALPLKVA